ncbi:hypothetical protein [Teichococcus wenyumeiae]|uniref:hypothetical protein n=1 Tax=Teichococcus wenyumeiae TaxID=2478470 RepID=UPI001F1B541B|nr:hypothetical protein [Pseudoroseomonas wenyumeiae]
MVPQDQAAQRPGAAADIQPVGAGRDAEAAQEFRRDQAAPAPDIRLIGLARRPEAGLGAILVGGRHACHPACSRGGE